MAHWKALTNDEKAVIIKESAKGNSRDAIAEKIGRHVRRFQKDPLPRKKRSDAEISKTVTDRDLRNIVSQFRGNLNNQESSFSPQLIVLPYRNPQRMTLLGRYLPWKLRWKCPLTPRYKNSRMEWARKYLKMGMSRVLFTDETRTTIDAPDAWANGWAYFGDERHHRLRPIRVPEGVKVTSIAHCNLLKKDYIPLSLLRNFVSIHDNASSHSARATQALLASLSDQG